MEYNYRKPVILNLENRALTRIEPISNEKFQNVTVLKLSNNLIKDLKSPLQQMPHLVQIDASFNQIESISECFGNIKLDSLKQLTLSNNMIKRVSNECLKHFENLTYLNLNHNVIEEIRSHAFAGNTILEHLKLGYNRLSKTLNAQIFMNLRNLKRLDLKMNNFDKVDDICFADLESLEDLNMAGNQLRSLDFEFLFRNRNLIYLNLSSNGIRNVCDSFFRNLFHLVVLNLSDNDFGDEMKKIPFTDNLQLRKLYISKPLDNIASLTYLIFSKCSDVCFYDFPRFLINGIHLEYLEMRQVLKCKLYREQFQCLVNLRYLDLSSNQFTYLDDCLFADLIHLRNLIMNNCPLKNILNSDLFENDCFLTNLSLNNCDLDSLPICFFINLNLLTYLDFSYNDFDENYLEESGIFSLRYLKFLNLENCGISTLANHFLNRNFFLEELHLENNPIEMLDLSMFCHLSKLKNVFYSDTTKLISQNFYFNTNFIPISSQHNY